jgi:hypothetical protein
MTLGNAAAARVRLIVWRRQPPLCPNRLYQSRSDWLFFTTG